MTERDGVMDEVASVVRLDTAGDVYRLITDIHAQRDLAGTMQAVVDAVVQAVGFGVAAVSIVRPDGQFKTIAVAGSDQARHQLLGTERPLSEYEDEFEVADNWGRLKFVPAERAPVDSSLGWVPDLAVSSHSNAWHPLDALFAPLRSSAGELTGVLSVDLPQDGLRPSASQRQLLEVLSVEAGNALDNALLAERLRTGEEIFRQAFDGTAGGMALIGIDGDDAGQFVRVNPAFCRIVGYAAEELLRMTPEDLTHAEDRATDKQLIRDLITGRSNLYRREKRYLHHRGTPVWVTVTATVARSDDGSPLCAVSQVEDISLRRAQLEELHHQARHDPLTNLPNRTLIFERLHQSVKAARLLGKPGALLFLDLDDFKLINDQHGHRVGDQVLAMIGPRIRSVVREPDLVGRLGGDEFVVIADNLDLESAHRLAHRIEVAVSAPITNKGVAVSLTVSVGASPITASGGDAAQILQDADQAMYRNKTEIRRPRLG
ncbi:diguanylate cyclase (GGDEF)-like protein/PAS domain S-box-containing protein [Nakamurella sp. UYEF19]|uniref:diguanylate cyclase n=1 Tax=Nakamurella sp. UYEF19 TaxID=1756392 RepID=UPI003397E1D7